MILRTISNQIGTIILAGRDINPAFLMQYIVDEPVESGDILVDEDGGVWEVQ